LSILLPGARLLDGLHRLPSNDGRRSEYLAGGLDMAGEEMGIEKCGTEGDDEALVGELEVGLRYDGARVTTGEEEEDDEDEEAIAMPL